jgi:glycosyltransferase involved in cell wall biosynthesis
MRDAAQAAMSGSLRIAFDPQTFAMQTHGGASRYFTRLAQGLLALEQQVAVFAPLHRNTYLAELPAERVDGRYIRRYPPKTARLLVAYNQLRARSRIARYRPDVVHETYYSRIAAAPRNCPTVITVLDMIHEIFPESCPDSGSLVSAKRKAIERADHVICISKHTQSDLMRLYDLPGDKVSVVHLGFDRFEPDLQTDHSLPAGHAKSYILYVGQRSGYKNFTGLLEAMAQSPSLMADFDLIAFGGLGFSSVERALMASLGFSKDQVQHRTGDDRSLGACYRSASAFVYPSLYEGFGIPPLEAMAQNCPVVSSNKSSMPEVIGQAGEYFDPTDRDDMRCAIERVVYSDIRIESLRQAGAVRLSAFSWVRCARETLDIYRSLV